MNLLAFIGYTVFVTYISLRPMGTSSIEPWDKVGHVVIYAVFALLGSRVVAKFKQFVGLCISIVGYSALMEVVQSYMPGRVMSFYDLLANLVGVMLGAVLAKWVFRARSVN